MPDTHFDKQFISGSALGATSVLTALIVVLKQKGVLSDQEIKAVFDAALSSLEASDAANSPDFLVARALVDAQLQTILTGQPPKPSSLPT